MRLMLFAFDICVQFQTAASWFPSPPQPFPHATTCGLQVTALPALVQNRLYIVQCPDALM